MNYEVKSCSKAEWSGAIKLSSGGENDCHCKDENKNSMHNPYGYANCTLDAF